MTQSAFSQQPTSGQQPYRQLRRSRDDRVVAGICAGVGRYLNIDPVAARVLFVILAVFSGGTALLAYLIAWIVMPEEPATPTWGTYSQPPTGASVGYPAAAPTAPSGEAAPSEPVEPSGPATPGGTAASEQAEGSLPSPKPATPGGTATGEQAEGSLPSPKPATPPAE